MLAAMQKGNDGPPRRQPGGRIALQLCADSFLALACLQTPGALIDTLVRHRVGGPMTLVFEIWAAAIVLALLRRRLPAIDAGRTGIARLLQRHRFGSAIAAAFLFACALTVIEVPRVGNSRKVIADLELAVELPSRDTMDCNPARGCHLYKVNEFGFRGPAVRGDEPSTLVIAVVGDSHIYGIGVDEDQTIPAQLERRLRAGGRDARVGNAGIPGVAMVSFPSLIEYAVGVYAPDLVIALIKQDDVDDIDHITRMMSLDRSLLARMLYILNWEIVYEAARQLLRAYLPAIVSRDSFVGWLDDMRRRCAGRKLLLVTDLDDALGASLGDWIEKHAEIGWYSSWDSPDWYAAPRIPGDGHWNGRGNDVIAKTISTAVARMLDGEPVRPRKSNGTR